MKILITIIAYVFLLSFASNSSATNWHKITIDETSSELPQFFLALEEQHAYSGALLPRLKVLRSDNSYSEMLLFVNCQNKTSEILALFEYSVNSQLIATYTSIEYKLFFHPKALLSSVETAVCLKGASSEEALVQTVREIYKLLQLNNGRDINAKP